MLEKITSSDRVLSFREILETVANANPDRLAFTFLRDGEDEEDRLTYGELSSQVSSIASRLLSLTEPGSRALLLFQPGLDFITAFLGCLYAGIIAVPAYPPALSRRRPSVDRLDAIVRNCSPTLVLTTERIRDLRESTSRQIPGLIGVEWVGTDSICPSADRQGLGNHPEPDQIAFLQYTSGSTGDPKGVMLTHRNIFANQQLLAEAMGQNSKSVAVGWLPLFHDMGLIGMVLHPLFQGASCVFMSPMHFLQRPIRWLRAISKYKATISGGPNFGYDLCTRKISESLKGGLDLSNWEVAFSGAEPIRAETVERFSEKFKSCGFKPEAMYPCYGLAEATLMVSGWRRLIKPEIKSFPKPVVNPQLGKPCASTSLVGCGSTFQRHRIRIVDPQTRLPVADGRPGEIWFSGPSVAIGYWDRPDDTQKVLRAKIQFDEDPSATYLRTGDLGVMDGGNLYVTGRLKDVIVLYGRKIHPQDIELTVEDSSSAIRPNCGAAFQLPNSKVALVYELEPKAAESPSAIIAAILRNVLAEHGLRLDSIVLVRAGAVPKTSSGKIMRFASREAYVCSRFQPIAQWPAMSTSASQAECAETE